MTQLPPCQRKDPLQEKTARTRKEALAKARGGGHFCELSPSCGACNARTDGPRRRRALGAGHQGARPRRWAGPSHPTALPLRAAIGIGALAVVGGGIGVGVNAASKANEPTFNTLAVSKDAVTSCSAATPGDFTEIEDSSTVLGLSGTYELPTERLSGQATVPLRRASFLPTARSRLRRWCCSPFRQATRPRRFPRRKAKKKVSRSTMCARARPASCGPRRTSSTAPGASTAPRFRTGNSGRRHWPKRATPIGRPRRSPHRADTPSGRFSPRRTDRRARKRHA